MALSALPAPFTPDNSKKSSRTAACSTSSVPLGRRGGGGNTRSPASADTLVGDQSGTYRVPGVQAEDHLPPGRPSGRRVRCGTSPAWLAGSTVDVVAPRRTRLTGLFSFGPRSRQATAVGRRTAAADISRRRRSRRRQNNDEEPVEVTSAPKRVSMIGSALPKSGLSARRASR